MKFVFALALVCLYVALMRARPNVDINKRAVGDSNGNGVGEGKAHPVYGVPTEKHHESAEKHEESGEAKHQSDGNGEKKRHAPSDDEMKEEKSKEKHDEIAEKNEETGEANHQRKKRAAEMTGTKRWKGSCPTIPYCFETSKLKIDKKTQDLFRQACMEWTQKSGVTFKENCEDDRAIDVNKGVGCWSMIGYTDKNEISLGEGCDDHGVILHELGHALGLIHEVKRCDRDEKVKVEMGNVKKGYEDQFKRCEKSISAETQYDFCGIMQYRSKAFSENSECTIVLKDKKKNKVVEPCMGSQELVSVLDGWFIAEQYQCVLKKTEETIECKNGGYQLAGEKKCICSNLYQGDDCADTLLKKDGKVMKDKISRDKYCGDHDCVITISEYGMNGKQSFGLHNYENRMTIIWDIRSGKKYPKEIHPPETVCAKLSNFHVDQAYEGKCFWDMVRFVNNQLQGVKTLSECDQKETFYMAIENIQDPETNTEEPKQEKDFRAAIVFQSDGEYTDKGFDCEVILLEGDKTDAECKNAFLYGDAAGSSTGGSTGSSTGGSTGSSTGGSTDFDDSVDYYDYEWEWY